MSMELVADYEVHWKGAKEDFHPQHIFHPNLL